MKFLMTSSSFTDAKAVSYAVKLLVHKARTLFFLLLIALPEF